MAFLDRVLQEPSYQWQTKDGELVVPTTQLLFTEAFRRINVFQDKRNWISMISWLMVICMLPFFYFLLRVIFHYQIWLSFYCML